jgi:HK97 family phage prohead protease
MSFSDIEFKASSGTFNIDQAQGIVECFVAGVGNKDSVGDVLLPGAFNGSLRRRKPRVVWGHNWNDPIGKVLEIYEVPPSDPRLPMKMKSAGIGGLYARVQFNLNSEKGKEAFANVAFFGEEQEWSIGYKTIQASFDPNLQANILKEVELYEVSPVLHGANQLTGTISVKSDTAVLDESKGHGMAGMPGMPGMMPSPGMPSGMMKPMAPKPQQVVKPVRPSIPESPLMVALRRELVKRSGSNVIVRTVTENIVIFDRLTSDGQSSTYRVAYNFQDGEFMFGKPERVQAQTVYSPADTERATPMENFNVSIKPQADAYMGDDPEEFIAMPGKSEDFDFDGFDFDDLEAKVGRALNNRNLSKLKTVMEMLQDIVASAEKEKEVEVKEYLIAVDVKDAFHTKQLLDPIMDYHRVDSYVSEKGIVVTLERDTTKQNWSYLVNMPKKGKSNWKKVKNGHFTKL